MDDQFSASLKSMRESKGLTQSALARLITRESEGELRFTQQTIARIETNARRVTVGEAFFVAQVLGTSTNFMVGAAEGFWADIDPRDRIEGAIRELEERARRVD